MNYRRIILVIFMYSMAQTLWGTQSLSMDDALYKKLTSGEVVFADVEEDGDKGIEAVFILRASPEELWNIITDYQNYARNFESIEKIQILNQNDGGATLELWISSVVKTFHYKVYRHHVKQYNKLTWRMISGDFKTNHGSWEITRTKEGHASLIRYRSFVEIDGFFGQTLKSLARPETLKRINRMVVKLKSSLEPVIASGKKNVT